MSAKEGNGSGRPLYLSQEWLDESAAVLNSSEMVRRAARGSFTSTFQHYVTHMPESYGTNRLPFYSRFENGVCLEVRIGVIDSPEITLTGSYPVWKKIHSGCSGIVASVLTGRVRVRLRPFSKISMAWTYWDMFNINSVIAGMPTEYAD